LGWSLHFNDFIVNNFLSYLLHKSNSSIAYNSTCQPKRQAIIPALGSIYDRIWPTKSPSAHISKKGQGRVSTSDNILGLFVLFTKLHPIYIWKFDTARFCKKYIGENS
jgi:hypothetical protein